MWLGKFMEISGIKGYNILITCDNKIHADDPHKTKEKNSELKLLNGTAYNELILDQ